MRKIAVVSLSISLITVSILIIPAQEISSSDPITSLYSIDQDLDLISIDPFTGAGTVIGPIGYGVEDFSFGPNGTMYASADIVFPGLHGGAKTLLTVNTSTGAASIIGPIGFNDVDAIAFAPNGTLYGADYSSGNLITIDPMTGAGTAIGPLIYPPPNPPDKLFIGGMDFSSGGILYGTEVYNAYGPTTLVTINTSNGMATPIGLVGVDTVEGLAFSYNGTLYGLSAVGFGNCKGDLLTIDPLTGMGTIIGNVGATQLDALAASFSAAFPPPLPPVADAGQDQVVFEGDCVKLDGSDSYDLDGTIVSYEWDFNGTDGLCWDIGLPADALGPSPTFIYNSQGIFTVTLNVTDDNGSYSLDSCTITVLANPVLYIDMNLDGNGSLLHWDPPLYPGMAYYLLFRSPSQIGFDFKNPWVNTSSDFETGEIDPIPLRTMWDDKNATHPMDANYEEEYYYTMRAVNIMGGISRNSRTVGKWTKSMGNGTSAFSVPLEPLESINVENYTSYIKAEYIKYMDNISHTWIEPDHGNNTDKVITLGETYEVNFINRTLHTFFGMPGAMIIYDDDSGFSGFDFRTEAKNLSVFLQPNGDVNLTWTEPVGMASNDYYEVYYTTTRDGFFGTLNVDYFVISGPVSFGMNMTTHVGAGAFNPGAELYYMVVPFNQNDVRGTSTYSLGIWTEEYLAHYDTFGIPLKLNCSQTADWFCDNILETVGMNYYNYSMQRWGWHSSAMPSGAFDPIIEMTEGYQISTSSSTKFTFIGI